jgi:Zn finger protein HypA/HybF involved in hydrogenase expression
MMDEQAADTPSTRRCTICALSLPNSEEWKECPQCGESTDIIRGGGPNVTEEEATSMLRQREFDEYLEKEGKK